MSWIFENLVLKYEDPIREKLVDITSDEQRYSHSSPHYLLYWNDSFSYTISMYNASFTIEFRKYTYKIFKYKIRSIQNSCHSNGWIVEGSLDNTTFYTLHIHNQLLCGNKISSEVCEESFDMMYFRPSRFIKVIQPEGECGSSSQSYFGLSALFQL